MMYRSILCNCDLTRLFSITMLHVYLLIQLHFTLSSHVPKDDLFTLSIIHWNDFHARFEEINRSGDHCRPADRPNCLGGYSRLVTTVKQLQRERQNPIYLNAGDNFQGTFWYNIGKWNVTAQFLNILPADAITIGNHEFDDGIEGLVPFIKALHSPVLLANVNDTDEPHMKGLYVKSMVIVRSGRKIGIIGLILSTVDKIATTGRLRFLDEIKTVRIEAAKIRATGVDIIIALSHCGIERDTEIAQEGGSDLDIIVGGHSHSLLLNGALPIGSRPAHGVYPIAVKQSNGHQVLIVQASAFTQYVGDLVVRFDAKGEVFDWIGNPVYLDESISKDLQVEKELQPWRKLIEREGQRTIGHSAVTLKRRQCFQAECPLGNYLANATADYYRRFIKAANNLWTSASIVLFNVGSFRVDLNAGNITIADLRTILPNDNTMDYAELRGSALLEVLEHAVSLIRTGEEFMAKYMIQFAGLQVLYNITQPVGKRVVKAEVLCHRCSTPIYEPIQPKQVYPIITTSYLIGGGDGFIQFPKNMTNHRIGPKDTDIIIAYLQETGPVSNACVNRRIQFVRSLRYVKSNLPICHGALKILVNPESDSSNI